MQIVETIEALRAWRRELPGGAVVGFVPTMGALHEGHRALLHAARRECDHVIASVFVNPTQFGPGEDFDSYPRDRGGDTAAAAAEGVDLLWFGDRRELYPEGFATRVEVPDLARALCGRSRPHHFGGVALIVLKLFNLVRPRRAYFGRKDYQQLVIIRRMAADLDLEIEVVGCPIVREPSGLALSSRNLHLTNAGRGAAAALYAGLQAGREAYRGGERRGGAIVLEAARRILDESRVELEYLELVDPDDLRPLEVAGDGAVLAVAARVEGVRLIDNVELGGAEEEARP